MICINYALQSLNFRKHWNSFVCDDNGFTLFEALLVIKLFSYTIALFFFNYCIDVVKAI